jgi:hypothetical protein
MFLNDPLFDIVDSVGAPIAGAKAYFYLTGTTTLTDTYTTSALSTPNTNPVIADSAGRFPPIYLNPAISYRMRIYDAADVLLIDRDPIAQADYFARTGATNTFTAQQTFTASAEPIVVNRTTSPQYSISVKDNGTQRGFLGAASGFPLIVSNAAGTYAATVSDAGSLALQGNLSLGAGSGIATIDINGGSVASTRYYTGGASRWAVGYAAGSGTGNDFQFYNYGLSITAMDLNYSNSNLTVQGTVRPAGAATTASAANAFMNSGDGNALLRSTSSRRYKRDIEPLNTAYAERVLALEPVWYRSKSDADKPEWSWFGLIAEDVATIEPRLVHWMQDGDELIPDGVQYERLAVLLLSVVKQMRAELNALKAGQEPVAATFSETAIPPEFEIYVQPDESIADLKVRLLIELTRLRSMAVGRLDMTDQERAMLTALEGQVAQRWFTS